MKSNTCLEAFMIFLLLVSDSWHKGKTTGLIADSYWNNPSRGKKQNDGEKCFKLNRVVYIQVHFWLFRESISIIPLHAGYHRLLVHICLVRMGITANMWPFSPNLYIWKVFFRLPLISVKFIWFFGLLFSDMRVILDTVCLNCFHFQYEGYIEPPGRRRREETFKIKIVGVFGLLKTHVVPWVSCAALYWFVSQ